MLVAPPCSVPVFVYTMSAAFPSPGHQLKSPLGAGVQAAGARGAAARTSDTERKRHWLDHISAPPRRLRHRKASTSLTVLQNMIPCRLSSRPDSFQAGKGYIFVPYSVRWLANYLSLLTTENRLGLRL